MEEFFKIFNNISSFDIIYIFFTLLSLIKCYRKGFILSILAASKWLLAYVLTLIIFPRVKPFVEGIIDSEYVLDIILGVGIFVIIIFLVLMINKGIGKAVTYSGLGSVDKTFGLIFGIFKGYVICVCIFSLLNWFYPHQKWPVKAEGTYSFDIIYKGSKFLIEEFPNSKDYYDSTEEKLEKI